MLTRIIKKNLNSLVISIFILMIVCATLSFKALVKYEDASSARKHSSLILERTQSVLNYVLDTESSQREFFDTRDVRVLKLYVSAKERMDVEFDQLTELVYGDFYSETKIDRMREIWRELIEVYDLYYYQANQAPFPSNESRKKVNEIRELVKEIRSRESSHLVQKEQQTIQTYRKLIILNAITIIIALVFTGYSIYLLKRNLKNKNAEAAELESQKQRAREASDLKSEFLANMSHEIRTPMNGILGLVDLLKRTQLTKDQAEFIHLIQDSGKAMLTLLNNVLDFSKIEANKIDIETAAFDLNELIENIVGLHDYSARHKGLSLVVQFDKEISPLIISDQLRLRQILTNLLSNAIKFSHSGQVTLSVKRLSHDTHREKIEFSVTDQGPGMSPQTLGLIFESFTQGDSSTSRKYGGTGLGLSISKRLVELLGGEIKVQSEVGQGSAFSFILEFETPIVWRSVEPTIERSSSAEETDSQLAIPYKPRILVAEDHPVNQKVILGMLKELNCETVLAQNGEEAIERAVLGQFDLVLMDCHMPGVDGFDASRAIRKIPNEQKARIPIVAVTANLLKGTREQCYAAGMNDYLVKPVAFDDLKKIIEQYVVQKTDQQSLQMAVEYLLKVNGGSCNLAVEVMEHYLNSFEIEIDELENEFNRDVVSGVKYSHKIKSTPMNLGLRKVKDPLEHLERALELNLDTHEIQECISATRQEYKISVPLVKNALHTLTTL